MNVATMNGGASMKLKALSAILLTVVISLAALASEQRRMHIEIANIDADDEHKIIIARKEVNEIKEVDVTD